MPRPTIDRRRLPPTRWAESPTRQGNQTRRRCWLVPMHRGSNRAGTRLGNPTWPRAGPASTVPAGVATQTPDGRPVQAVYGRGCLEPSSVTLARTFHGDVSRETFIWHDDCLMLVTRLLALSPLLQHPQFVPDPSEIVRLGSLIVGAPASPRVGPIWPRFPRPDSHPPRPAPYQVTQHQTPARLHLYHLSKGSPPNRAAPADSRGPESIPSSKAQTGGKENPRTPTLQPLGSAVGQVAWPVRLHLFRPLHRPARNARL